MFALNKPCFFHFVFATRLHELFSIFVVNNTGYLSLWGITAEK